MATEWVKVTERLPKDGQVVAVRFGGITVGAVLFQEGRFWQVRTGPGAGMTYPVEEWRAIEEQQAPVRKGRVINVEAADGVGISGKGA